MHPIESDQGCNALQFPKLEFWGGISGFTRLCAGASVIGLGRMVLDWSFECSIALVWGPRGEPMIIILYIFEQHLWQGHFHPSLSSPAFYVCVYVSCLFSCRLFVIFE